MQGLTHLWHCSCVYFTFITGPSWAEVNLSISLHVLYVLASCNCKQSFLFAVELNCLVEVILVIKLNSYSRIISKFETWIFDLVFFACCFTYTFVFWKKVDKAFFREREEISWLQTLVFMSEFSLPDMNWKKHHVKFCQAIKQTPTVLKIVLWHEWSVRQDGWVGA